jgi:hypothetical protein
MGYEEFLSAIKDPKHEEHDNMLAWIGGAFDPEGFDLNAINRTLRFWSSSVDVRLHIPSNSYRHSARLHTRRTFRGCLDHEFAR